MAAHATAIHWHASLEDIRENLADGDFVQLIDRAARELTGKPADALTVFDGALSFGANSEIGSMKGVLEESRANAAKPALWCAERCLMAAGNRSQGLWFIRRTR